MDSRKLTITGLWTPKHCGNQPVMRWMLVFLFALVCALGTPQAAAADSNKATAEALFDEGRNLMAAGRYEEAVQKLKASQELDPGLGTLLNLAECYERMGRTASAWAEYREIAALARQTGAGEREQLAEQKIRALVPKLSKLQVSLAPGAREGAAITVTRDGEVVRSAELGVLIPVDPGKHVIEAVAPGKRAWTMTVEVGANADSQSVEVPPLQDEAGSSGTRAPAAVTASSEVTPAEAKPGATQRTLALIIGGVGVAGVALGSYFGLQAASNWSDAKDRCRSYPYACGAESKALEQDARSQATLSTVGFAAGGVLLAGGAALWFTAASDSEEQVAIGIGPSSVAVSGRF